MSVRIPDLPACERPRERLAELGPGALSSRELLAVVLGFGGKGASAWEIAGELLAKHKSLSAIARVRWEELMQVENLAEAKVAKLLAAFELGRRAIGDEFVRDEIHGPSDLAALVVPTFTGKPHEEVLVVVLNSANRLIRVVNHSKGGANRSLLLERDVLATVLRNDGVAFALAHNHPSGDSTPSDADIQATIRVKKGAELIGLRLLDHVIVTDRNWVSLREAGYI